MPSNNNLVNYNWSSSYGANGNAIDEKIDQYRQQIYSIIHTQRTVHSMYKKPVETTTANTTTNSQTATSKQLREEPVSRSQNFHNSSITKRSHRLSSFGWQPFLVPQKTAMTSLVSPAAITDNNRYDASSASIPRINAPSASTLVSTVNQKTTEQFDIKKQQQQNQTSIPPFGNVSPSTPTSKSIVTNRSITSDHPLISTHSDWSKSFESLNNKRRSNFVNNVQPVVPIDKPNDEALVSNQVIRRYTVYMPGVELGEDGRISVNRVSSPISLDEKDDEHPSCQPIEKDNNTSRTYINSGTENRPHSEASIVISEYGTSWLKPHKAVLSFNVSHSVHNHFFEFGHRVSHSQRHKAAVTLSPQSSRDLKTNTSEDSGVDLQIISTSCHAKESSSYSNLINGSLDVPKKAVIFADILESVQMIPGRQLRKKKVSKRNKKKIK